MDHDATADAKEEAKQKMDDISLGIEEQLHIKGVADKINKYMTGKKTLIVFQDDRDCISPWEDTRNALSLINCSSGIECSDGDHKQEPEGKRILLPTGRAYNLLPCWPLQRHYTPACHREEEARWQLRSPDSPWHLGEV